MTDHDDEQQPPLPLDLPEPPAPPAAAGDEPPATLDALIQAARVESATKADGGAVGAVVERLAAGDGSALVATLRAEGFPDDALAAAATTDPGDRRRKPRARLGIVAGQPHLWLTTTGWQAAGRSSGRERPPSAESAAHATAPADLGAWLAKRLAPWPSLRVTVVTGAPVKAFSDQVTALAWGRIQGAGDTTGRFGALTSPLRLDALLVERWANAAAYESAWGHPPDAPEDLAEQTLCLEVERARKAAAPLRYKVERHTAALALGAAYGVVWVVTAREVARDLTALGVGAPGSRQLLVPATAVGLDGDPMPDIPAAWWPLRLNLPGDTQ